MNLFYSNSVSLPYTKPKQELPPVLNTEESPVLPEQSGMPLPTINTSKEDLLLRILTQANLSDTAMNQSIVKELFSNQLPLHREMILSVLRESIMYSEHSIESIVFLHKADIPVSEESLQLLEQYRTHTGSLHEKMGQLGQELLTLATSPEMPVEQVKQILMELMGTLKPESELTMLDQPFTHSVESIPLDTGVPAIIKDSYQCPLTEIPAIPSTPLSLFAENELNQFTELLQIDGEGAVTVENGGVGNESTVMDINNKDSSQGNDGVSENVPMLHSNDTSPEQVINTIMKQLDSMLPSQRSELISSKVFRTLITQAHTNRFLLSPEQLKDSDSLEEYYEDLSSHVGKLDSLIKGQAPSFTQSDFTPQATSAQDHLSMMSQLNQMYTYLQLPLKLQEQITHADLFVLTNKKKQRNESDPLTLLLHLDMDHLGALDVHMKLTKQHLHTNFHVQDVEIVSLLEHHFEGLSEKLTTLGFHVTLQSTLQEKSMDFMDELKKENQLTSLGNYSFDIRT